MHFYRVLLLAAVSLVIGIGFLSVTAPVRAQQPAQQPQQRLVENVDIIGNRRLRKEDILYYIQTRAGDVYSEAAIARDLQTILALNFFDKVGTRVTIGLLSFAGFAALLWMRRTWLVPALVVANVALYGVPLVLSRPESTIAQRSELSEALRRATPDRSRYAFVGWSPPVVLMSNIEALVGLRSIHSFDSLSSRDYPVLMAMMVLSAAAVVFCNIVADIIYGLLDPRIRY